MCYKAHTKKIIFLTINIFCSYFPYSEVTLLFPTFCVMHRKMHISCNKITDRLQGIVHCKLFSRYTLISQAQKSHSQILTADASQNGI